MADILTPGTSVSVASDGTRTFKIPVATTTDTGATPPAAPAGTRLISFEYTQRDDGGRDYVFTYEGITTGTTGAVGGQSSEDVQQQINGQAAQEPIETHPKFNGQGGPAVTDADLAEIRRALQEGNAPNLTGTGSSAMNLYKLMLKGVTHFYTPSGITYSETTDQTQAVSISPIGKISIPPPSAPQLPANSNWLLIGLRAEKKINPENSRQFWRVTREWLASGPRGWNADFDIYS